MEILIKIPDEVFEAYKHWDENKVATVEQTLIAHGTVLPEGHGRLIDANDVDNHIIGSVDLRDCPTIIEADKG